MICLPVYAYFTFIYHILKQKAKNCNFWHIVDIIRTKYEHSMDQTDQKDHNSIAFSTLYEIDCTITLKRAV